MPQAISLQTLRDRVRRYHIRQSDEYHSDSRWGDRFRPAGWIPPRPDAPRIVHQEFRFRADGSRDGIAHLSDGSKVAIPSRRLVLPGAVRRGLDGWWLIEDLEDYARSIGLLDDDETVDHTPWCSRCKSREPVRIVEGRKNPTTGDWEYVRVEPARYLRQCRRCYDWSDATRRDPWRCTDCRRPIDEDARSLIGRDMLSRCSRCHEAKLGRERRKRRSDGQQSPLSPFWNRPWSNV